MLIGVSLYGYKTMVLRVLSQNQDYKYMVGRRIHEIHNLYT